MKIRASMKQMKRNSIEHQSNVSEDENIAQHSSIKKRRHNIEDESNMKVFELNLSTDKALNTDDLLKYMDLLKVPSFRGVFKRDELPKHINVEECGIVNLSPHEQLPPYWVCYAKLHKTRLYLDPCGQNLPLQMRMYMKTEKELRDNVPVITRNSNILLRADTKISGHLCLLALTSLMREHVSFEELIEQLKDHFS